MKKNNLIIVLAIGAAIAVYYHKDKIFGAKDTSSQGKPDGLDDVVDESHPTSVPPPMRNFTGNRLGKVVTYKKFNPLHGYEYTEKNKSYGISKNDCHEAGGYSVGHGGCNINGTTHYQI